MAVYTEVSFDEAAALIARLSIGELKSLQPISSGIENTNYFADTAQGRYVITLFERLTHAQLPFYLGLMQHLARRGLPVPEPRADAGGQLLHRVAGKPAALVNRLPGHHQLAPDLHHCAQLGHLLARMHLAAHDFPMVQPNLRGLAWWAETVPVIRPFVEPELAGRPKDDPPVAFVNPEVVWASDETQKSDEGCLSFPNIYVQVERPMRTTVKAQDLDGNWFELEGDALLARCLLHENDHLTGKLLVDFVGPLKRQMIKRKLDKMTDEEAMDILRTYGD